MRPSKLLFAFALITGSLTIGDPVVVVISRTGSEDTVTRLSSLKSEEAVRLAADEMMWHCVSAEGLLVVIDRQLTDLRALEAQIGAMSQLLEAGGSTTFKFQRLTPAERRTLSASLTRTAPGWWPLFERNDLVLSVAPNAEITLNCPGGPRTHYLELPFRAEPPPEYSTDLKAPPGTAQSRLDRLGVQVSSARTPNDFRVSVMGDRGTGGWKVTAAAMGAVELEQARMTSKYRELASAYLRTCLGEDTAQRLLASRNASDLPKPLLDRLSNDIEARRAQFGVPPGQDVMAWLLTQEIQSVSLQLFGEFRYRDDRGNPVTVSVALPRG